MACNHLWDWTDKHVVAEIKGVQTWGLSKQSLRNRAIKLVHSEVKVVKLRASTKASWQDEIEGRVDLVVTAIEVLKTSPPAQVANAAEPIPLHTDLPQELAFYLRQLARELVL